MKEREELRLLVADEVHEAFYPLLPSRVRVERSLGMSEADLYAELPHYDGLVSRTRVLLRAGFVRGVGRLRFIARAGAGTDDLDVDYFQSQGVRILSAPEGNRVSVGEHSVGLLLSLLHRLYSGHKSLVAGLWQREAHRGEELRSKVVGIVGYGHMGSSFARCLRGFGCRVLAYDKYKKDYAPSFVEEVSLSALQREAEVISLHVPLTRETRHMVNGPFFQACAHPVLLLNTSRGGVVSLRDLVSALRERRVVAAGLDVFPKEPPSALSEREKELFSYLLRHERVLLSPHVAGWSVESHRRIAEILAHKIRDFLKES